MYSETLHVHMWGKQVASDQDNLEEVYKVT